MDKQTKKTIGVFWIEMLAFVVLMFLLTFGERSAKAWEIDLSRRRQTVLSNDRREPAGKSTEVDSFDEVMDKVAGRVDRQEFVILNTERGFVPSSIRVKKGNHYTIHIVNVNDAKKNVSFMLDAFAQNHATYFGKIKTFVLDPNKEGIFTFNCPETSAEGKMIVFSSQGTSPAQRALSSDSGKE